MDDPITVALWILLPAAYLFLSYGVPILRGRKGENIGAMEVEAPSRGAEMPLSVRRHTRGTSPVPTVRLVLGSTLSPWKIAVLNRAEARKFAELLDKAAAEIKR